MGKIRNSDQMSQTKKYSVFFKEIGLRTADAEEKALKCRNFILHPDEASLQDIEK
jgi:hypothetical protein